MKRQPHRNPHLLWIIPLVCALAGAATAQAGALDIIDAGANAFTVSAFAGSHGWVSPAATQVTAGGQATFTAAPTTAGYGVDRWVLDTQTIVQLGGSSLTLTNISAAHRVDVHFKPFTDLQTFAGGMDRENVEVIMPGRHGEIYVGGNFTRAGQCAANRIACWDGQSWTNLGAGVDDLVTDIAVAPNGDLVVGGWFTHAGGQAANYIARWDGVAWTNLGSGLNGPVVVVILGTNGDVYAGGGFTEAGGVPAHHVARWNGQAWTNLGEGVNRPILDLAFSPQNELYAGGWFTQAGGAPANRVARWNGHAWTNLAEGLNGTAFYLLFQAESLYVAGYFTQAGGRAAKSVAMWDGTAWTNLGAGVDEGACWLAFDDTGAMYVSGFFTNAGGQAANRVAKWADSTWTSVGSGVNDLATTVMAYSNNLYVGGDFDTAFGVKASGIAMYSPGRTYAVNAAAAGAGGSISPTNIILLTGQALTFTAQSMFGYSVAKWYLNGEIIQIGGSTLTLADIRDNYSVAVSFARTVFPLCPFLLLLE